MSEGMWKRLMPAFVVLCIAVMLMAAGCLTEKEDSVTKDKGQTGGKPDPVDDDPDDDEPDNGTGGGGGGGTTTGNDTWTFMVYMSDCDLEYFAITDINEMETVGSGDRYNIIVQLDRWDGRSDRDDTSNGDWKTAKRFLIQKDSNTEIIGSTEIMDIGEINCGDPSQLVNFVKWAMETYPAQHYFLDLWDHGNGIEGVCWDESVQPADPLDMKDLKTALSQITDNGAKKIDVIGFDACLMSTIEVAYELSPYADHMIASQVTEPGTGWDYSFLSAIKNDPEITPDALGRKLVDSFTAQKTANPRQSHTLALLDLAKTGAVKEDIDLFIGSVKDAGSGEMQAMKTARAEAQPARSGQSSAMIDLYDYMSKAKTYSGNADVKANAQKVMDSTFAMITYFLKYSGTDDLNVNNAHGLSIYAPEFGMAQEEHYSDTSFQEDSSWEDLLEDYYSEFQVDQVIYFVPESLMYVATDEDEDGYDDAIWIQFEINSYEDWIYGYLSIDVYDNLGYLIDYLEYNIFISSDEYIAVGLGELGFLLEAHDGPAGYYQMVIYMCLGDSFDIDQIQDYAYTDYLWLEIYGGGGGGGSG